MVELFRSFRCLARRAVLAIDLERGPLAYHFLPSTRWLFGWHDITINDGQISVAAALKKDELLALAVRAGLDGAQRPGASAVVAIVDGRARVANARDAYSAFCPRSLEDCSFERIRDSTLPQTTGSDSISM